MEINGKSPLIDLGTRTNRLELQDQQAQRQQKVDRGSVAADPDRVELSVRSREIQHIDELIRSTPDVREGLVERVRRSIENGTYNVKAEQVAEKILGGSLIDQIF
ncbi:MAG: flagellar biosynthesis anti-sigma factor FlgM [Acidobacteriia bacterium]|nr:flagellar biosynthesis anti-sigma factor FlgM [Terriglobia bacterium]